MGASTAGVVRRGRGLKSPLHAIIEGAMAMPMLLSEFAWDEFYRLSSADEVLTPALVIYPDAISSNIERTLELLSGDVDRWRVHVKTAKLDYTLQLLLDRGVRHFKCATTLELLTACARGARDVLFAYPAIGASARRVQEIALQFPHVSISVLAENETQVRQWRPGHVGIFIDINPGMNRTGIEQGRADEILALVKAIRDYGLQFRGLHYYDGHHGALAGAERMRAAHQGYDRLLQLVTEVERKSTHVQELITAGTPTLPSSLAYAGFQTERFVHRVSPGTVIYCDATSLAQLPQAYGYRPAALVLTRVVSHPSAGTVTCDAGHKAVSADAGVPTCVVMGHTKLTPLSPSEEHLPMSVGEAAASPQIGSELYLLPRHVCPTVNNFDFALRVQNGKVLSLEKVSARGHEAPLTQATVRGSS
jgi:D-serine deaminase-like pyridoxal phosphate-dependent protein